MAESIGFLSAKVRDSLRHSETAGRGWDKLDMGEKAKALVEIERMLFNDKDIIKKNRVAFVLEAFNSISNTLIFMPFEEIQEALLHLASDSIQNIMIKVNSLFPVVELGLDSNDPLSLKNTIDKSGIKSFFNENEHGNDKEILSELIIIHAFGTTEDLYSEIQFYTCDKTFVDIYEKYRENECISNYNNDKQKIMLINSLNSISLLQAY